jgi:hypothetical protein
LLHGKEVRKAFEKMVANIREMVTSQATLLTETVKSFLKSKNPQIREVSHSNSLEKCCVGNSAIYWSYNCK